MRGIERDVYTKLKTIFLPLSNAAGSAGFIEGGGEEKRGKMNSNFPPKGKTFGQWGKYRIAGTVGTHSGGQKWPASSKGPKCSTDQASGRPTSLGGRPTRSKASRWPANP